MWFGRKGSSQAESERSTRQDMAGLVILSKSQSLVCIANKMSESFPLMVGVGQGDPLSILLFCIYIDDLLEIFVCRRRPLGNLHSARNRCESAHLCRRSNDLSLDPQDLQVSINHVAEWLKRWCKRKKVVMVFNPMEGQSANVWAEQRSNTWTLDIHTLLQFQSYKYLCMWLSENGSWDLHASKALAKMRATLGYWRPLLSCHRIPIKIRAMMIHSQISLAWYQGLVHLASQQALL